MRVSQENPSRQVVLQGQFGNEVGGKLGLEFGYAVNSLANDIYKRRVHPSYITPKMLRIRGYEVDGMRKLVMSVLPNLYDELPQEFKDDINLIIQTAINN